MRFSWLLFVVVYVFSVHVCLAVAQDEGYRYHVCSGANYTSNSIYQKNLNTLLSSISSNSDIDYGFYNFSEGDATNRVNAIALCRGDISRSECRKCVSFSTADLPARCPTQKEAIVWYDTCMLRYSNQSIFCSVEYYSVRLVNTENASDADQFKRTAHDLLYSLQERALLGDSRRKFAIGDAEYVRFRPIYGLVQCTPDLSPLQCKRCLTESSFGCIETGRQGCRSLGPSCTSRYEIYQFYDIPPAPAPAPAPSSPPLAPPAIPSLPPTGGGSNTIRNIIVSIASIVCFVILLV